MPTIPTPFIGGAGSPQRDTAKRKEFAPPYHPGSEEPAEVPTPAPEPEPAGVPWESDMGAEEIDVTFERVPVEADAGEWVTELEASEPEEAPPAQAEIREPQEAEPAEPVLAEFKTVAIGPPFEPASDEAASEEAAFEPIGVAGDDEAEVATHDLSEEEGEGYEFPSYLFGPDATTAAGPLERDEFEPAVAPEDGSAEPGEARDTAERLTELSRELLAGDEGERIQALIDDLRPLAADIAVPRAFAAGYLAAKRRQEK